VNSHSDQTATPRAHQRQSNKQKKAVTEKTSNKLNDDLVKAAENDRNHVTDGSTGEVVNGDGSPDLGVGSADHPAGSRKVTLDRDRPRPVHIPASMPEDRDVINHRYLCYFRYM
jgi:hypothetical protein